MSDFSRNLRSCNFSTDYVKLHPESMRHISNDNDAPANIASLLHTVLMWWRLLIFWLVWLPFWRQCWAMLLLLIFFGKFDYSFVCVVVGGQLRISSFVFHSRKFREFRAKSFPAGSTVYSAKVMSGKLTDAVNFRCYKFKRSFVINWIKWWVWNFNFLH